MRITLLVAGLVYGSMPMHWTAAAATAVHAEMVKDGQAHFHHDDTNDTADCSHGTIPAEQEDQSGHLILGDGHCSSTCLTIAPNMNFIDADVATDSVEVPGLAPRLDSVPIAPLERPPRSRG